MILIKIRGGLGNQMFQYAAAKCLAVKKNTQVKLDTSGFSIDALRNPELNNFSFTPDFSNDKEVEEFLPKGLFNRLSERIKPYPKKNFYKQPFFHFDDQFFNLPSHVYLSGYFQSELFFKPVENIIRKEYTIKKELILNVAAIGAELQKENSVAVHIRRGDYLDKEMIEYHGILGTDYYKAAIHLIKQKITNPHFYIFSDDPSINLQQYGLEHGEIISGRKSHNHFEDLYLMTQCKHHIIANSSFSWWAAWLNNNPNKIVIAPKKWFGKKGPRDIEDLIPSTWMRL